MEEGKLIAKPMKVIADVITLGSSSEDDDDDVHQIKSFPKASSPTKRVKVVHLASANSPKIEAQTIICEPDIKIQFKTTSSNGKGACGSSRIMDEITLSSDDENELPKENTKNNDLSASVPGDKVAHVNGRELPSASTSVNNKEQIVVLLEDDENANKVDDSYATSKAVENIQKLLDLVKPKLSFGDRKKLKDMLFKKFDTLRGEPPAILAELSRRIDIIIVKITQHLELNVWKYLKVAKDQFNSETLKNTVSFTLKKDSTPDEEEAIDTKKEKLRAVYEGHLKQLSDAIEKFDSQDVDWDAEDDHRSSYMRAAAHKNRLMKDYYKLCKIFKCSKLTGRPIQKAITLKNISKYPETEKAVEKLVNSKGYSENTDYNEILDVVTSSSIESGLHLSNDEIASLALTCHKAVVSRRQQLRKLDSPFGYPSKCDLEAKDPAEQSPDLEEKLVHNLKIGRTISSVIDEFAERQEQTTREKRASAAPGKIEAPESEVSIEETEEEEEEEEEEEVEEDNISIMGSIADSELTDVETDEGPDVAVWDEPLYSDEDETDFPLSDNTDEDSTSSSGINQINEEASNILNESTEGEEDEPPMKKTKCAEESCSDPSFKIPDIEDSESNNNSTTENKVE